MSNAELIHKFYRSFAKGDVKSMVACYDPNVVFKDPAFGELKGEDVFDMWRMLIERGKGTLIITFGKVSATEKFGSAEWIAEYVFAPTGRKVVNRIFAEFEFHEGKIIVHTDHFDLWKWSRQAMGWKGLLLGWTPFMQTQIQKQTNGMLKKWKTKK